MKKNIYCHCEEYHKCHTHYVSTKGHYSLKMAVLLSHNVCETAGRKNTKAPGWKELGEDTTGDRTKQCHNGPY